jgi:UDP-glucose 4-epimerase
MKALVLGGSGFLGSHVADALSRAGHEVTVFDIAPSPYLAYGQKMLLGDVTDPQSVSDAVKGQDWVLHFAGLADLDDARTRPRDTVLLNVLGTVNLLEACVAHQVKRVAFASTVYVYSEKGGFYRCSKQAAETYIEEFHRRHDLEYTILRYGTLYGPRADERNSVYRYLKTALTEPELHLSATGEERREYIYVGDAADLTTQVMGPEYANQRITITGHQSIYFKDIIYMIREIVDKNLTVRFSGEKSGSHYFHTPYSYVPKAGKKLSLNMHTDLGQGLIECLAEMEGKLARASSEEE